MGDPTDHFVRFSKMMVKPTYNFGIYSTGDIYISPYIPITFGNVKKHTIKEYWEAGLKNIWESQLIQKFASAIRSEYDLCKIYPSVYYDDNIKIDLVENSKQEIEEIYYNIFNN